MQATFENVKEASEAHEALVAKNANKKLLNLGELREVQDSQNALLSAICEHLEV